LRQCDKRSRAWQCAAFAADDLELAENRQRTAPTLPLLFRGSGFLSRTGTTNLNHGVDAMTDTDGAVTTVVARNYDGIDPVELDRLSESLEDLRRYWGEPDTVGDNPGR
jgi:hypothetical protein